MNRRLPCNGEILEKAKIFKKESSRIPEANQSSCAVDNPALLCKRGELLELARSEVCASGYVFKKSNLGRKRQPPKKQASRSKVSAEIRQPL